MKITRFIEDDGIESRSTSPESLYLRAFADLYSGRTKVTRLILIADRCDNQVMKMEALRMAYEEIKKGNDSTLFKEVVAKIGGKLGDRYCLDEAWVDHVNRKFYATKENLEVQLSSYMAKLSHERIRQCYNNLGELYHSRGQLDQALDSFISTQNYCSTPEHILEMCLNAILVSIEMGGFSQVTSYISRAERLESLTPATTAKLCCADGLSQLKFKNYKLAARKFLKTGSELGSSYANVIAAQDVATYGGLCALASFESSELKNYLIDNANFWNLLEIVPQLKEIVSEFHSRLYTSSLDHLKDLMDNLSLDLHMHDQIDTLYTCIRNHALIQYTQQFVYVDLSAMAEVFGTDVSALEEELVPVVIEYQKQLLEQDHAATIEVGKLTNLVRNYEDAIEAGRHLQEASELQSDLNIKEKDLGSVTSKMIGKKSNRKVEWEKSELSLEVKKLSSKLLKLEIYTKHAMKDLDEKQICDLLSKAKSEEKEAIQARGAIHKRLTSTLNRRFGCASARQVRGNEVYIIKNGHKVAV